MEKVQNFPDRAVTMLPPELKSYDNVVSAQNLMGYKGVAFSPEKLSELNPMILWNFCRPLCIMDGGLGKGPKSSAIKL